jgi:hypothetical protein
MAMSGAGHLGNEDTLFRILLASALVNVLRNLATKDTPNLFDHMRS